MAIFNSYVSLPEGRWVCLKMKMFSTLMGKFRGVKLLLQLIVCRHVQQFSDDTFDLSNIVKLYPEETMEILN